MTPNKFGQLVYNNQDLCDLLMQGHDLASLGEITVAQDVQVPDTAELQLDLPKFSAPTSDNISVEDFHRQQQQQWHMPTSYQNLDIAAHVLSLCATEAQLQRCGAELLMFQERGLFDLLRYLKYLVDTMKNHGIIWGVGRGSSVASYVLYLMGVHRIDSLYYDLDPEEFLR